MLAIYQIFEVLHNEISGEYTLSLMRTLVGCIFSFLLLDKRDIKQEYSMITLI